jgi:hypothetical protein
MRRREPQEIAGPSARAQDNNPDTEMRGLKFEGNRCRRFCGGIWTGEGYPYWIIGDFSENNISRQRLSSSAVQNFEKWMESLWSSRGQLKFAKFISASSRKIW